jgi:hypothetical protein
MNAELWYIIVNVIPLPWWGLMILAPKSSLTQRMTQNYAIFVVLAALYGIFLGLGISQFPGGFGFDFSYEQIRQFLSQSPLGFVAAWLHYLAFDLFVGFWVYQEGLRLRLPTWQTSLCLLVVLMVGPLGLGLFLLRRRFTRLPGVTVKAPNTDEPQ